MLAGVASQSALGTRIPTISISSLIASPYWDSWLKIPKPSLNSWDGYLPCCCNVALGCSIGTLSSKPYIQERNHDITCPNHHSASGSRPDRHRTRFCYCRGLLVAAQSLYFMGYLGWDFVVALCPIFRHDPETRREEIIPVIDILPPHRSLQPTPGSTGRFTSLGPAWLSLGR